ncbi:TPA: pyridoxal phosphate-dependent aminotransferase, partial [Streptococcus suis]|nr:pyridoxal phosphate-dependent aminotransferase [Streptococcus suis]
MKQFNKSTKLDDVAYDIRGPVLEEAMRMRANGEQILRLNTGNPAEFGFTAPDEVIRDLIHNARKSEGYSNSKGIFSARKAIMQYCQLKKFPNVDIEDIYLGNGVSELIVMSMQGLLDNGDEVLVPMPDYPLWTAAVSLAGGKAVHYVCDEAAEWYPDLADMESKVTSRTKAIVLINPNNPTGALYPKEILEGIIDIARRHELIIFSDEIYDRMVFDGAVHIPIATLAPDLFVVTMNGLSKSHRICGFRVGWMVLSGPKKHVKGYIEGLNMLSNMRLCSNVLAQQVVQTSLGGYQSVDELLMPGGRLYEQREFITKAINDIPGLSAVKPKAGLYVFPKIDREMYRVEDDEQFVLDFLKQEKVLLVHGRGFNWKDPDHFRIV